MCLPLREYLQRAGRGSVVKLSRDLNAPASLISDWANGNRPVPADRCPDIEAATGVRCEDLRQDVNWAVLRGTAAEPPKAAAAPQESPAPVETA